MIAALYRDLEALPRNDDALPISERASKLAEIEAQIFNLETQEECLIECAHQDGIILERRHDQGPASILGVQIAKPISARVAA